MRLTWMLLALTACFGPDVNPTIAIRSPNSNTDLAGYGTIEVRSSIEDERNGELITEVFVDGEPAGETTAEGCRGGCSVAVQISTAELDVGTHLLEARVTDPGGKQGEAEPVEFVVADVPYVDQIAVHNVHEGLLDGTELEVEVHLLDDHTNQYVGCASLPKVQQPDLPYEDLKTPFVYTSEGAVLLWETVQLSTIRVVVIESDGGDHCPSWPALTDLLETDVDDRLGVTGPVDFSVLFNDDLNLASEDFSDLVLKRGRPLGKE